MQVIPPPPLLPIATTSKHPTNKQELHFWHSNTRILGTVGVPFAQETTIRYYCDNHAHTAVPNAVSSFTTLLGVSLSVCTAPPTAEYIDWQSAILQVLMPPVSRSTLQPPTASSAGCMWKKTWSYSRGAQPSCTMGLLTISHTFLQQAPQKSTSL